MAITPYSQAQDIKFLKDLKHIKLDGIRFRIVDAKGQVVGRLATQIASMLLGKDKPCFTPKKNIGDVVVVINAAHVQLAGDKWNTKLYRYHTGYPGGLVEQRAVDLWDRDPRRILYRAVKGMLPHNKLRIFRMEKLKIFPEENHPFKDLELVPHVPPPRKLNNPDVGYPLPQGLEPVNPARYTFRLLNAQYIKEKGRPAVDFGDLLTEEERQEVVKMAEKDVAAAALLGTGSSEPGQEAGSKKKGKKQ